MDVPGTPKFFHDVAGVVMMPGAVLLLFGKSWLMDRLVVSESAVRQKPRKYRDTKEKYELLDRP